MGNLENGMLVQHASLGLGKVVALEEKAVHVFFATSEVRFATKLRLPMTLPFLAPASSSNAWLSGLSGFSLDEKSGRYGLAGQWLSHGDAVARFLEVIPTGFGPRDDLAAGAEKRERVYKWRRAHEAYVEAFGNGEGERLLEADDVAGLVERALGVEKIVRTLHKDTEKASFEDALKDLDAAKGYFAALFELLATEKPEQSGFDALAAAVEEMMPGSTPEARWPIVTLLPFVARPDVHMVLRPKFACETAQRLGQNLAYAPRPSWRTYSALLTCVELLLAKLEPLGARDHVDVDAFMHAVMTKPSRPRAKQRLDG